MIVKVGKHIPEENAFSTIQEAIDCAKALGAKKLRIELSTGTFRLLQPVIISQDMGFEQVEIIGKDREKTVISGSVEIVSKWLEYKTGIYWTQLENNLEIDMLYVNGKQYHMARYPKYDESNQVLQGYAKDCISKERAEGWSNPKGGYFHAMHNHRWGDFHYRITGKDGEGNVLLEGGTQNNRRTGMHEEYRYVENIFEELSGEGEWFYNKEDGKLYVIFEKGTDIKSTVVETVVNEQLIRVIGTQEYLQSNVVIKNLTLKHTKRTFMKVDEPLLRSDWCIHRDGALYFENTQNCKVENCDIVDLGSNAICVNGKNTLFSIISSLVRDIAGNGICFMGKIDCVRSPLFEYNERLNIHEVDLEKGPLSDQYPSNCEVVDCLITRTGRVEKQTAAVQVSMSKGIRISNCALYELPRAAINFSEGNFGGHIIEHCDIFDTVLETGDHGSFNSWGRDRYWELEGVDLNNLKTLNLQQLPFLDAVDTNIIRNNRIRCDYGWDIDLDDGSSNYEIYNNLCLNGGIKLREGFGRRAYNNITVNNSLHTHVWFKDSGDVIKNNVFFDLYKPIRMNYEWGDEVDYNIIHSYLVSDKAKPAEMLQKDSKKDIHSVICNCRFKNIEGGDYTVQNQEVLDCGFVNFDMKSFGVITPRLKAISKIPELPSINPFLDKENNEKDFYEYGGVTYKNITSLEEASAYGAGSKDGVTAKGVIICDLSPFLELAGRGLKKGDIIIAINGVEIMDIQDLEKHSEQLEQPIHVCFKILRQQVEKLI